MTSNSELKRMLQDAISQAQKGNKDTARNQLLQLIQLEPSNHIAWLWLADTCDTETERKAILSRAVKINPQNSSLKEALNRAGAIRTEKAPRSEEKNRDVDQASVKRMDFQSEPDLDWLADAEEPQPVDDVATISDEEFSKLSQAFFESKEPPKEASSTEAGSISRAAEPETEPEQEKKVRKSFLDFLRREGEGNTGTLENETRTEQPVPETPSPSDPEEKKKIRLKKEEQYQAIEDELKQAFVESQTSEKVNRIVRKKIPKALSKILMYTVVLLVMLLMVMGGLFLVEQYKLRKGIQGNLIAPTLTATQTMTPDIQGTIIQQTIEAEITPSPVNFQDLVSSTEESPFGNGGAIISIGNASTLELLSDLSTSDPFFLRDDLQQYVLLQKNEAKIYDVDSTKEIMTLSVPVGEMLVAADFSEDGTLFAAVTRSMTVSVWSLPEGILLKEMVLPESLLGLPVYSPDYVPLDGIYQLVIAPDNLTLTFGYWGTLTVWNIASGEVIYADESLSASELVTLYHNHQNGNYEIAYSSDGRHLALGITTHLIILNLDDLSPVETAADGYLVGVSFVDATRLLYLEQETQQIPPQVTVLDLTMNTAEFNIELCALNTCSLTEDSRWHIRQYVVSVIGDWFAVEVQTPGGREIHIHDLRDGQQITRLTTDTSRPLYGLAASPDGSLLTYSRLGWQDSIRGQSDTVIWDTENEASLPICETCLIPFGVEPLTSWIGFSPDGKRFAVCAQGTGYRILIPSGD